MQTITISGTVHGEVMTLKDKKGRTFLRFFVVCGATDLFGRAVFNYYRCTCYMTKYDKMKDGDQVFVIGQFLPTLTTDEKGRTYQNLDVMVTQITGGYRAEERNKKK